ncbi:hypothetical protein Tco_0781471 [Tanacetum coccineum]
MWGVALSSHGNMSLQAKDPARGIEMATELMDKSVVQYHAESQAENKRKFGKTLPETIESTTTTRYKRQTQVLVYLRAVTARGLAIWTRIVRSDMQMLTTTTNKQQE